MEIRPLEKTKHEDTVEMVVNGLNVETVQKDGYHPISILTSRGTVECRYYASTTNKRTAVFIGGIVGGWDSPGKGQLYAELCKTLAREGINCLHVKYRYPAYLAESILDVLAGITFVAHDGAASIALIGYSFGAAVALQAAATAPQVKSVITLATQSFGTDAVSRLRTGTSLLCIHGMNDSVLPPSCSMKLYDRAPGPKKLMLLDNVNHAFDTGIDESIEAIKNWLHQEIT